MGMILDQYGQPMAGSDAVQYNLKRQLISLRRELAKARYDAAQTVVDNQNHWSNADNLDPHQAASPEVRRRLRSRSRYEVLENNPYLKGTVLTITNDFVGTGPILRVSDKRISKEARELIEYRWRHWARAVKLRNLIWRLRMGKIIDGESFAIAYVSNRVRDPIPLNFMVVEPDQVSSASVYPAPKNENEFEIDGVRFDKFMVPTQYHVLNRHPGADSFWNLFRNDREGKWISANRVLHWFRKDRGWLRGIPETAPSLPLCALLRRYTLATVQHAEVAADLTAILETEGPALPGKWGDQKGTEDDPFDVFPIERGSMMNLPWGYKLKQLEAVPLGDQYDAFVGALLREITRPLLSVAHISAGTSKDSNMSSTVVDQHIYKGGQWAERRDCNEQVMDSIYDQWWQFGIRTDDYFTSPVTGGGKFLVDNPSLKEYPPEHEWGWDNIGLDHTDPQKVAESLAILHNKRFLTDRDIQEIFYNKDVDEWREQVLEDDEFRKKLTPFDQKEQQSTRVED